MEGFSCIYKYLAMKLECIISMGSLYKARIDFILKQCNKKMLCLNGNSIGIKPMCKKFETLGLTYKVVHMFWMT